MIAENYWYLDKFCKNFENDVIEEYKPWISIISLLKTRLIVYLTLDHEPDITFKAIKAIKAKKAIRTTKAIKDIKAIKVIKPIKSIKTTIPLNVTTKLERTYYRNDSKRPAISEPKQILDVTSHLLSGILCKQYPYLLTKK